MYIQDIFTRYYDYRPFRNAVINKIIGNSSKILGILANVILPTYFHLFPGKKESTKTIPVIISLTTFPKRINNIWLILECILRQSKQPQSVILHLSKEQFPTFNTLPKRLNRYIDSGFLKIKLVEGDIKSHKKYWYIVQKNESYPIITIDDDIIYESHTIETLWNNYQEEPNTIIACYCKKINWNIQHEILPYSLWNGKVNVGDKGLDIFFGSGGGTLFPINSLKDANEEFEIIKNVCPFADDIWLNAIIRKNGYQVKKANAKNTYPEWMNWKNVKLSTVNNGNLYNDKQLFNVISFFQEKYRINPFIFPE